MFFAVALALLHGSPSICFSQFTAMASADRFAAWAARLAAMDGTQRDELLEAVESMLEQGDANVSDQSTQPRPFRPGVPPQETRVAGWAVDNSIRMAFHALAQSVMTEDQQERHKFNSLQINKLQRATAFSCSEGAESVWPQCLVIMSVCMCSCSHVCVRVCVCV